VSSRGHTPHCMCAFSAGARFLPACYHYINPLQGLCYHQAFRQASNSSSSCHLAPLLVLIEKKDQVLISKLYQLGIEILGQASLLIYTNSSILLLINAHTKAKVSKWLACLYSIPWPSPSASSVYRLSRPNSILLIHFPVILLFFSFIVSVLLSKMTPSY